MSKCGACGKFLPTTGNVKCSSCKNTYHKHCMDKSSSLTQSTKIMCSLCSLKNPTSSTHKASEEINEASSISSPLSQLTETSLNKFIIEMQRFQNCIYDLKSELTEIRDEIKDMRADMNQIYTEFRDEIKDMRTDMNQIYTEFLACKDDVSKLSERTTEIEKRFNVRENTENVKTIVDLQETIYQLKCDSNENEQQYLRNDVELIGVPETKDENLQNILEKVSTKLKIPINDGVITDIFRVGPLLAPRNIDQSEAVDGQAASDCRTTPRPIVVRCARREHRDRLLAAARARPLTTADVGLHGNLPTRLYINERLTKFNKKLLYKVMEEKKKLNWKFVWIKEGRILIRREERERAYRIRKEEDLININ